MKLFLIPISDHPLGATFAIRVQPRAARTAITGTVGAALKVSLSAPPLDPGFPVETGGTGEQHAAFFEESRTGGSCWGGEVGNPGPGRANVAVVEFFSEVLSVPRSAVQVVAGERSRNKVIRIAGCGGAEVQRMLREHFTV